MKVLHLSSEYPPQQVFGLGRFVHDLAAAQAAGGDEATVVTNSLGGEERDIVRDAVRVCRVGFPPPPKPPLTEAQVMQFNVAAITRAVQAWAKDGRWDVINAHDWYLFPAADVLRRHLDVPICLTIHDTIVGKTGGKMGNADRFIANVELWASGAADSITCCSRFMKEEVVGRYGADPGRIHVVPCGVDPKTFQAERLEYLAAFRSAVAAPGDRIVLYVGRLDPEKGVDLLVEAVPQVLSVEPRARFLLAGKGRRDEELRANVRDKGLAGRVSFLGYAGPAPLAFLYRCADVQACPSSYEPFGIVALEGMVNGVPVVVPDATGLAEIVEDGQDGLKFPAGSAQGLAEALLRLLGDAALRERLGGAAHQKALREYGWPRIAEQTALAYKDARASRRPTA